MSIRPRRKAIKPNQSNPNPIDPRLESSDTLATKQSFSEGAPDLESLKDAVGTDDKDAGELLLKQIIDTMPKVDMQNVRLARKSILAILRGISPRDQFEGLIVAAMAGTYFVGMEYLALAAPPNFSVEVSEIYLNRSAKMIRRFTELADALDRHRGKTSQQMVVGNVNVNDGGQAIVGTISHPGPRKVSREDAKKKAS